MTWATDGNIYAAWGDGPGWGGKGTKYYMGVTRLSGWPPNLSGTEVWKGSADGSGGKNRKPSGGLIADADGKMYTLYETPSDGWNGVYGFSSGNHGRTWSESGTKVFSKSGDGVVPVGFLQFGPGYTGIPSDIDGAYFYMYLAKHAEDPGAAGINAYLARVLKRRVFTRSAYTYLKGTDRSGKPVWTSNFSEKVPVFSDPAGVTEYHINVTYHPVLKRYMWASGHSKSHLGVFEGANPWGPWKTVYYGQFRDRLWKFTYQFPQKWMSADGKTMWMSWSGWPEYDNVNFIKATLTVSATPPSPSPPPSSPPTPTPSPPPPAGPTPQPLYDSQSPIPSGFGSLYEAAFSSSTRLITPLGNARRLPGSKVNSTSCATQGPQFSPAELLLLFEEVPAGATGLMPPHQKC